MMRSAIPPIALLLFLSGLALWNAYDIQTHTDACVAGIDEAVRAADIEDWPAAEEALAASYLYWQSRRDHLRTTVSHGVIDAADSMYCRAIAFAKTEELTEFRAETAGLRIHLLHLAENERFLSGNIF